MKPVARVALIIVRFVGIAWFALWAAIAVLAVVFPGPKHRLPGTLFVIAVYSLPGAAAAATARVLLRRDRRDEPRHGFDVLPPKHVAGPPEQKR